MSASLRKNFVFDATTVAHLEDIAKQKKLEAFDRFLSSLNQSSQNLFLRQFTPNDNKIIQKVKAMME